MQPKALALFQHDRFKARLPTKISHLIQPVGADIPMSQQIGQGHLRVIYQPKQRPRRGIIPQDKAAAASQHPINPVKKALRIRIMVKTIGTDHRIKGSRLKGQVLTCLLYTSDAADEL